jgi:hypothetical protein
LDRLAILNGIRDGDAPSRIADQWNITLSSIVRVKTKLYDDPLNIFEYHVVIHQGKGDYQCVFCGESKSRQALEELIAEVERLHTRLAELVRSIEADAERKQ